MNPYRLRTLAGALAASFMVTSPFAAAEDDVSQIKQQLDELDQKIRVLQRLQELDKEAATAKAKETASVSAGKEGFFIKSGDNAYSLRLGGNIQFDSRWYFDKGSPVGGPSDTFIMRKVRPVLEGVFYDKIAFRMMADFGNGQTVLQDAYIEYRHNKYVNIRAGKYKPPMGLERLVQDSETEFVERGLPTNLVPNRDIGVQWAGAVLSDTLSYQFGVFNGVVDNSATDTADTNDNKDYMARIIAEPFKNTGNWLKGLGVGIAYSYGVQQGTVTAANLPQYKTVGQVNFFTYSSGAFADGERRRVSPQLYYYVGPFGLMGEYVAGTQQVTRSTNQKRDVDSKAWQLAGFWVVTGEDASYRSPNPGKPYNIGGDGWGAVELVARFGAQTIDDSAFVGTAATRLANPNASAREARYAGLGVNWYFSRNFKIQVNYDQTLFDGGAAGGADQPREKALFTRFQANF
jgi:phosphate-selective porin OprO/OprP